MINKTLAKIICIFAVIVTVGVIIWANIYSAPYRAVENFFAALGSGDKKAFDKVSDGEVTFDYAYDYFCSCTGFSEDENPDFKVKYKEQEKVGETYIIDIVLTAYNDERYTESSAAISVTEDGFVTISNETAESLRL
jgi:hypothetical protein